MTYYFRSDRAPLPDTLPKDPHACAIRTPTNHVVYVCTAGDADTLRRALMQVFEAGKQSARREIRDALGLPPL